MNSINNEAPGLVKGFPRDFKNNDIITARFESLKPADNWSLQIRFPKDMPKLEEMRRALIHAHWKRGRGMEMPGYDGRIITTYVRADADAWSSWTQAYTHDVMNEVRRALRPFGVKAIPRHVLTLAECM